MSKHSIVDLCANVDIEAERKYSAQSNKTARVKIERGHAWLIRLLPFPQGKGREAFARLAQHWIDKRVVMCKLKTAPNFGGDPSFDCPICRTVAECKNDARDDAEKDEFYQIEARETYRCYCLVFRKEDDKGQVQEITGDEMFVPHEFNIPKTSFALLASKIERSKTRKGASPAGLLDLISGCDIWAIRDNKNSLTFDLSEDGPGPIFTEDDQFDAKIERVWKQMRQPSVKFLAEERMEDIAAMVAEKAFEKAAKAIANGDGRSESHGNSRFSGGGRGRFHEGEDDDSYSSRGRGRFSGRGGEEETTRSSRRTAFDKAKAALGNDDAGNDGAGEDDDQIPGAEVPARKSQPARREVAVETASPSVEEAPEGDEAADQADQAEEAPAVSSRRGGASAKPAGQVSVPPAVAAGRRAGAPVPAPKAGAKEGGRIDDDDNDPPEETADPAPAEDVEKAPVDQPAKAAPARSSLHGALRNSVTNLASRGR